jgi:hypothetical protein
MLRVALPTRFTQSTRFAIVGALFVLALHFGVAPSSDAIANLVGAGLAPARIAPAGQVATAMLAPTLGFAGSPLDPAAERAGALADPADAGDAPDLALALPAMLIVLLPTFRLKLLTAQQAFPSFVSALDKPPPKLPA